MNGLLVGGGGFVAGVATVLGIVFRFLRADRKAFLENLKNDREAFLNIIGNHITDNTRASEKLAVVIEHLEDFLKKNNK